MSEACALGNRTDRPRALSLTTTAPGGRGRASQEQRNRLARLVFEEVVINDDRVAAVKPRPELAGFFALDCQVRGLEVNAGGSDGGRLRERYTPAVFPSRYPVPPPPAVAPELAPPPQKRPHLPRTLWPEIAERARSASLRDLAMEYGVSHETIRGIARRAAL